MFVYLVEYSYPWIYVPENVYGSIELFCIIMQQTRFPRNNVIGNQHDTLTIREHWPHKLKYDKKAKMIFFFKNSTTIPTRPNIQLIIFRINYRNWFQHIGGLADIFCFDKMYRLLKFLRRPCAMKVKRNFKRNLHNNLQMMSRKCYTH